MKAKNIIKYVISLALAALLLWALLRHWGAVGGLDVFLQLSSCHLACLFPDQEILGYFYYY